MQGGRQVWHRLWGLTWWIKAPVLLVAAFIALGIIGSAMGGGGDGDGGGETETATVSATASTTSTPGPTATPHSTNTPTPAATSTPQPTATVQVPNRRDCDAIRGTDYRSAEERDWYLSNCLSSPSEPEQPVQPPPDQQSPQSPPSEPPPSNNCDPSYPDVCIPIGSADYDCAGGSGNGPNYIQGPIRVLPPDPHDLDRDGDGWGCE